MLEAEVERPFREDLRKTYYYSWAIAPVILAISIFDSAVFIAPGLFCPVLFTYIGRPGGYLFIAIYLIEIILFSYLWTLAIRKTRHLAFIKKFFIMILTYIIFAAFTFILYNFIAYINEESTGSSYGFSMTYSAIAGNRARSQSMEANKKATEDSKALFNKQEYDADRSSVLFSKRAISQMGNGSLSNIKKYIDPEEIRTKGEEYFINKSLTQWQPNFGNIDSSGNDIIPNFSNTDFNGNYMDPSFQNPVESISADGTVYTEVFMGPRFFYSDAGIPFSDNLEVTFTLVKKGDVFYIQDMDSKIIPN